MPEQLDTMQLTPRSPLETAQRVLALLTVVGKVYDPIGCVAWMRRHKLEQFLSRAEAAFVEQDSPPERSRVTFSWRAEGIVSLLWALNGLREMPPLDVQFDVFRVEMVSAALNDPDAFLNQARLRSAQEISDMESGLYHQHWRVRDAELVGIGQFLEPRPDDPPIEDLDPSIVYERRYALSWLVGWGEDWDNVPTDT